MNEIPDHPIIQEITIDLHFSERAPADIRNIQQAYGGIKVYVDGNVLTRYAQQEELEQRNEVSLEYKGSYPFPIVRNLASQTASFVTGIVDPTKSTETRIELYDSEGYLVLSWLTPRYIRIAFQTVPIGASEEPSVPIQAALGFAVDGHDMAKAVATAGEELLSYIDQTDITRDDSIRELNRDIRKLREFSNL